MRTRKCITSRYSVMVLVEEPLFSMCFNVQMLNILPCLLSFAGRMEGITALDLQRCSKPAIHMYCIRFQLSRAKSALTVHF